MIIHDVDQNSIEWAKLHIGIPTASSLDQLLTPEFELRKGEMPRTLVYRKVAEAWRGKPAIDLGGSSFAMEQGLILESEAIPFWELTTGRKVTRVGFITTDDGRFGCSPDGLLLDDFSRATSTKQSVGDKRTMAATVAEGTAPKPVQVNAGASVARPNSGNEIPRIISGCGIEIKCPAPHTHVKYLSDGVIPKEYRAQVYGSMFCTGFSKWVFMSYCRGFPALILEVAHVPMYVGKIGCAIEAFHADFNLAKKSIERWRDNPMNEFK